MRAERRTNARLDSGLKANSIRLRRCSTSGTSRTASFTRFAPMTEIFTFSDSRLRGPMVRGTLFHFAKTSGDR